MASYPTDPDVDAHATLVALAVVDRQTSEPVAALGTQGVHLLDQLNSIRTIVSAFDTLGLAPAAPEPPPFPTWGPFPLREVVGRGSFGVVCRAIDAAVGREIAVKLYSTDKVPAEPGLMARVRHPNVLTVLGAAVYEGRPGFWMEFVRGRTLAERVDGEGPLDPEEVVRIGIELCGALRAVHQANLVHQDVKARNVMEEVGGRIVLMDFGAGLVRRDNETTSGSFSGTPLYMAPEVLLGGGPSAQSDLYSLGVLLYFLLTGAYPVYAPTLQDLIRLHERQLKTGTRRFVAALRELCPDMRPALARCVAKALAPAAGGRYRTAAKLEAALRRAQRPAAPRWLRWAASVVVGAALCAGGVYLWYPRRGQAPQPVPALSSPTGAPRAGFAERPIPNVPAGDSAGVPPAVAEAPYEVEAGIYLRDRNGDRQLRSGDRVAQGDRLVAKVSTSRTLHLYVVNRDERGSAHLLFPAADCGLHNPLSAGRGQTLPGRCGSEDTAWVVSSAGGREHFLLVASPIRLVKLEQRLALLAIPTWAAEDQARGVGQRVKAGEAPPASSFTELVALARSEVRPLRRARGVWYREIVLESSGS